MSLRRATSSIRSWRKFIWAVVGVSWGLFALGCAQEKSANPVASNVESASGGSVSLDRLAVDLAQDCGWDIDDTALSAWGELGRTEIVPGQRPEAERELIVDDIYHYSFRIRTGPGVHDLIRLHRVVRENRPHRPIATEKSVFLVHGDYKDFVGCFLPGLYSPHTPRGFGVAVYLARNNVDVWGIDLGWALLPREITDFGFMKDWNMQRQIDDLRIGLGLARAGRALSGSGGDRIILLGYSMGASLGYCYLNDEAQRPRPLRHVKGYIPVDFGIKSDNPAFRDFICAYAQMDQNRWDTGIYQYSSGFHEIAQLARTDPQGDSPFAPGLTNMQFALVVGAGPSFGPDFTGHFLAGVMDENQMPVDFQFVTIDQWLDFLDTGVPYGAVAYELDQTNAIGDCRDVPYDDHLSQVTVPVLNVDAGGGLGQYTDHSLDLLGSTDVTRLVIHTQADPLLDFGHLDLFIGNNAEALVWRPLLDWVRTHSGGGGLASE